VSGQPRPEPRPLIRIVRMEFRREQVATFLRLFDGVKQRIRAFAGCRDLYLLRDEAQEHVYFTYSIWESAQALGHYRSSALFRDTWKQTRVLFSAPAQAHSLIEVERISPQPTELGR
jgi:quinol monooxygenase YgiN